MAGGVIALLFTLLHVWFALGCIENGTFRSIGDVVTVYRNWAINAVHGSIVGIDSPFVYPLAALVPILLALVGGTDPLGYAIAWMVLVWVADLAGLLFLLRKRDVAGVLGAAVWTIFLLCAGPISVGRIDSFTMPLLICGLVIAAARPAIASFLVTLAAWIKVWPAALVAVLVVRFPRAWRSIAAAAIGVSTLVAIIALVCGGLGQILSFLTAQNSRGIQVESPVATFFLWARHAGAPIDVHYDLDILTYQVHGPRTDLASSIMNPLLVLAMLTALVLGMIASRRGIWRSDSLAWLCLAVVAGLIAFNKVGSPQYVLWLAGPLVAGVMASWRRWVLPGVLALVIAFLTAVVYPYAYGSLIMGEVWMLWVISIRNALYLVLYLVALWHVIPRQSHAEREGHASARRASSRNAME